MSEQPSKRVYCSEAAGLVSAVIGRCASCCESCHEDANQFPFEWPLMDGVLTDGRVYHVCCSVQRGLVTAGLHDEEATLRVPL